MTLGHEQVLSVPPFRDNEINSVVEILNSRALAEKVVDAVGPGAILNENDESRMTNDERQHSTSSVTEDESRQRALRRFAANLDAVPVSRSNVIRVAYQSGSPEASQAVLGKLMDIFLAEYAHLGRPADGAAFSRSRPSG